MPVTFDYDAEHDLIVVTFSGFVNHQELLRFVDNVRKDEHFTTTANELIVADGFTGSDIDADLLLVLSQRSYELSLTTPDKKVALVPTSDLEFGFARTYQSMAEKTLWKVEIFRDRDEALAWLQE